jgi:hypothetical protein
VSSFCVLAVAIIFFSLSTLSKIKCQVLPILGVLRLQYLLELLKSVQYFLVHEFSYFSVTPMDLCYLYKLQIFILCLNKNSAKICFMFKGVKKSPNSCCFYWMILSFVVLSICLSLKMIIFKSFDI